MTYIQNLQADFAHFREDVRLESALPFTQALASCAKTHPSVDFSKLQSLWNKVISQVCSEPKQFNEKFHSRMSRLEKMLQSELPVASEIPRREYGAQPDGARKFFERAQNGHYGTHFAKKMARDNVPYLVKNVNRFLVVDYVLRGKNPVGEVPVQTLTQELVDLTQKNIRAKSVQLKKFGLAQEQINEILIKDKALCPVTLEMNIRLIEYLLKPQESQTQLEATKIVKHDPKRAFAMVLNIPSSFEIVFSRICTREMDTARELLETIQSSHPEIYARGCGCIAMAMLKNRVKIEKAMPYISQVLDQEQLVKFCEFVAYGEIELQLQFLLFAKNLPTKARIIDELVRKQVPPDSKQFQAALKDPYLQYLAQDARLFYEFDMDVDKLMQIYESIPDQKLRFLTLTRLATSESKNHESFAEKIKNEDERYHFLTQMALNGKKFSRKLLSTISDPKKRVLLEQIFLPRMEEVNE